VQQVEAPKPEPVVDETEQRRAFITEMMLIEHDAPVFVEEMIARDNMDLGTAPLLRLEAAVRYLKSPKGAAHLAGWTAARDAAMDAEVEYETEKGEG
jgi:hypothetical protein